MMLNQSPVYMIVCIGGDHMTMVFTTGTDSIVVYNITSAYVFQLFRKEIYVGRDVPATSVNDI